MIENAVWNKDEMAGIENVDRLLPSQPYFSKMYNGKDFYGDMQKLMFSVLPGNEFNFETKPGMTYAVMGSDINTLRFYQFLIRSHGYKRVLELGTYIGVSAMYLAEAAEKVDTVEKGVEFWKIAQRNIAANGFKDKIECSCMDAEAFLKMDAIKPYDMIILDCAKENYERLLILATSVLKKDGMILVDDVFFQGETLNNPISEKGRGVKAMLDYVATMGRWEKVILPLGNGLLLLRRKA